MTRPLSPRAWTAARSFSDVLLHRDHRLARHVAAPLRPHLVLEDHTCRSRPDALLDRPDDVEGVAIPGVHVRHDGNRHRVDDPPHPVHGLRLGEEAVVRQAQGRCRQAEARREAGVEACLLVQHRRQHVVGPRQGDDSRLFDQLPKSRRCIQDFALLYGSSLALPAGWSEMYSLRPPCISSISWRSLSVNAQSPARASVSMSSMRLAPTMLV